MRLTNEVLREATQLEAVIKQATRRLEEIKEAAKEHGPMSTKEFIVAVSEQSRVCMAGLQDVAAVFGRDKLEKAGLIKIHTFKTVRILRKVAA